MIIKVVTLLSLAVCVLGNGHAISEQKIVRHFHKEKHDHVGHEKPEHHEEYAPAYPSYEFSYKVEDPHTHDIKGQSEHRKGDEVKGEYWLYEPDGRKRIVKYTSDKHDGFKAKVEYSAPHHHIEHKEHKKEEHKPVEYKPEEHKPEEHKPAEHKPVEHKPVEHKRPKIIEIFHEDVKPVKEEPKHIAALSLHAPRYHKYEEEGYHPRNYRHRGY